MPAIFSWLIFIKNSCYTVSATELNFIWRRGLPSSPKRIRHQHNVPQYKPIFIASYLGYIENPRKSDIFLLRIHLGRLVGRLLILREVHEINFAKFPTLQFQDKETNVQCSNFSNSGH